MLPAFNAQGDLPAGVHSTGWKEFQSRFGLATPRRVWLFSRLQTLLKLAGTTEKVRRVFIWGSFVTAKPAPGDIDILLVMNEDFEVDQIPELTREIFESARAKLRFEADVFWARASIGDEVLQMWLDTYQTSRTFHRRGIVELELS